MKGRETMRKRIAAITLILLCLFGLFPGETAQAQGKAEAGTQFSGDVSLIRRDNGNYVMQVTVENSGEDFSGTVQLILGRNAYHGACAYNTEITIPAQGKKQFTVTVTEGAADTLRGMCTLNFLDEKGKVLQSIPLSNVFGSIAAGIPVGILSDDYSSLTYLDAGGNSLWVRDLNDSLALIELDKDNLMTYLDGLYFLVIDHYNVSTLDAEQIQAIQEWELNGGMLILGTGAYAEETLSGFDEDFLGVSLVGISEPGEENQVFIDAERMGYYYYCRSCGIDFSQMSVAELDDSNLGSLAYNSVEFPAIYIPWGQGVVGIFYCSLGESSMQWLESYMVRYLFEEAAEQSNYVSYGSSYTDMDYLGQKSMAFIDGQETNLNFTLLEVLIAFYVVLVGPILYLILRKCKKSEWYWGAVPIMGLAFIFAVYLFGQGARVNTTRAYSLTLQQADSERADTYIMAYHSGVKPWDIRLSDHYNAAGPGWSGYNYYYSSSTTAPEDYYYLVQNDGQGLSIGITPDSNFESAFFYANGEAERKGSIQAEGMEYFGLAGNISGTVTNNTVCDMAYMAVYYDSYIAIFSDVKAGETIDLDQAAQNGRCVFQYDATPFYDDILYNAINFYGGRQLGDYEAKDVAALLTGLGLVRDGAPTDNAYAVIAGVVRDYDRAVTEKCSETAYGCLFSYVEAR